MVPRPSSTSASKPEISGLSCRTALRATASMGHLLRELGEPQPAELPPRRWIEEIAITHAFMALRCRQRRAAQHHLAHHELSVVFAKRAFGGAVAWIG